MLIELHQVERSFLRGRTMVPGLRATSLMIHPGEFVAVLGPSGSGKSTLMNIIGLLDRPTAGTLLLDGVDCAELDCNKLALIRNRRIHRAYLTLAVFYLPVSLAALALWGTPWWHGAARAIMGV